MESGRVLCELTEPDPMRHAEAIGKLISRALIESGKRPKDIQLVAVGLGPAPFTGLRIGIAAAKFFARAISAKLVGVSSLDAIAYDLDLLSPTLVITDARRGEVYYCLYQGKDQAGPIRLMPPGVKRLSAIKEQLAGEKYLLVEGSIRPAAIGLLAIAKQAAGESGEVSAMYLRDPDARATSSSKRVSG